VSGDADIVKLDYPIPEHWRRLMTSRLVFGTSIPTGRLSWNSLDENQIPPAGRDKDPR
jgi:hypothetical protein